MGLLNKKVREFIEAGIASRTWGAVIADILDNVLPPSLGFRLFTDFEEKAGSTLPAWLFITDTSSAGTPTYDYVANGAGGEFAIKLATNSEVETVLLSGGDHLTIDVTKTPILEFRCKVDPDVTGAGGLLAAGDKIVIGLCTATNATFDSVVSMAWFLLAGANLNIYCETDDGTTDTDDKDTGVDYVAGTYFTGLIDCTNLADIRFWVNGVDVTPAAGMTVAALTNSTHWQFHAGVQKAAASNFDHRLTFDFVKVRAVR